MNIGLVNTSRRPGIAAWPMVAILCWASLLLAVSYLSAKVGLPVAACPLRALASLPCPACGSTRAAWSLMSGQIGSGFLLNPLAVAAGAAAAALLLVRMVFGKTVRLRMDRREKPLAWALAAVVVLANWAYVIFHVG